ncbi:zinc-dependent peptidase [Flavobacterium soli]|uniref:zinc-dependent peptidase n=1 Tax=Flavobacterium soli TaxID=344881 RepID=UPI000419A2D0|nr:zinc-dependent peptidase [Flavobacterium soli]
MDGVLLFLLTILLSLVVVLLLFVGFFKFMFEPAFILIFKRPVFLYWYPIPKKLNQHQRQILEKEFSFYRKLSDKKKTYFEHRVKSFLLTYKFVGNEIVVTNDVRIIIAGTYVMLTFGMRNYLVPLFNKIIVYPTVYYSTITEHYHKGEFNPRLKAVVFSWEDFVSGHQVTNNNINLGLHEFSHVLHFHALKGKDSSAIIFYDEFMEVIKYYNDAGLNAQLNQKAYFREYAYENQFEFLSVLLEHFFETPHIFKAEFPDLFQSVRRMINFDEKLLC